jgi:hypothetical protein
MRSRFFGAMEQLFGGQRSSLRTILVLDPMAAALLP